MLLNKNEVLQSDVVYQIPDDCDNAYFDIYRILITTQKKVCRLLKVLKLCIEMILKILKKSHQNIYILQISPRSHC